LLLIFFFKQYLISTIKVST
jgi:hypothetical protein